MWRKRDQEADLRVLLTRIDGAPEPTRDLVEDILHHACPRLQGSLEPSDFVMRLVEAEAWVELGLWLIGWELPEWDVHQLSRGTTPGTAASASAGWRRTGWTTSLTSSTRASLWRSSARSWKRNCGNGRDGL